MKITHMPTMIKDESNPPVDNIRIDAATTIEEAEEEQQQQTRHTHNQTIDQYLFF